MEFLLNTKIDLDGSFVWM